MFNNVQCWPDCLHRNISALYLEDLELNPDPHPLENLYKSPGSIH